MLADLELLLTAVFAVADDLLPWRKRNARRSVTDAKVVTLTIAQAIMDIPSDREFLEAARGRLASSVSQAAAAAWVLEASAAADRDDRVADGDVRPGLPGLLRGHRAARLDAGRVRPVGRYRPTLAARAGLRAPLQPQSQPLVLGDVACACSRPPTATPRAVILASADQKERDVALRLFERALHGGELVICDKGYAGRDFEAQARERFGATILRPGRENEPQRGPALSWIRQRIESIFWTLKDRLGLERHRARTLHGLRARVAAKLVALAAGVWLNHYLDQPTRVFATLAA
jgi:hypothetical protein